MRHDYLLSACRSWIIVLFVGLTGCHSGLVETMKQYDFTAISPPQTKWEVGSVIQVDPRFPTAPTLFSMPSEVPVSIVHLNADAPDISNKEDDKFDLQVGVSLPAKIKASLEANSVTQYSVAATGNYLVKMPISPYIIDSFPKIADKYGSTWSLPLGLKQLYYINELWLCKSLKYTLYDQAGVKVSASVPLHGVDLSSSGNISLSDDGSLIYNGTDPICVGYRARAVAKEQNGQPVAEGAAGSKPTAAQLEAHRFVPVSTQ